MKLTLIDCSVVLVTQNHVAPINHEFLVNQKVIPKNFQKSNDFSYPPNLIQIDYKNGFSIVGELNRTLFQFSNPNNTQDHLNLLKEIASKYISLFNIAYQVIGINFNFIRYDLEYQSFIKQVVKLDSPHLMFDSKKLDNIDLSYNLGIRGKQFNVNVSKKEQPKRTLTYFKINVHYPGDYADDKTVIIGELEENYKKSTQFIEGF